MIVVLTKVVANNVQLLYPLTDIQRNNVIFESKRKFNRMNTIL